jgi:hypothetical protein
MLFIGGYWVWLLQDQAIPKQTRQYATNDWKGSMPFVFLTPLAGDWAPQVSQSLSTTNALAPDAAISQSSGQILSGGSTWR